MTLTCQGLKLLLFVRCLAFDVLSGELRTSMIESADHCVERVALRLTDCIDGLTVSGRNKAAHPDQRNIPFAG
jgi:hypothetical protein